MSANTSETVTQPTAEQIQSILADLEAVKRDAEAAHIWWSLSGKPSAPEHCQKERFDYDLADHHIKRLQAKYSHLLAPQAERQAA